MRMYEKVWLAVRDNGAAQVRLQNTNCSEDLIKRIIKAVRKEKYMDTAWKLQQLEQNKKFVLLHEHKDAVISFTLVNTSHFTPTLELLT